MNKSIIFFIGILLLAVAPFVSAGCSGTYPPQDVYGCTGGAYGPGGRLCTDIDAQSTCNSFSVCTWERTSIANSQSCSSLSESSCSSTSGCTWTPVSSGAHCEGDYVSACTVDQRPNCGYYEETYNDGACPDGCSSDAPFYCEEVTTCIDDYYAGQSGNCGSCRDEIECWFDSDVTDEQLCPLSDCRRNTHEQFCDATFTSCAGLDKTSCESKTETNQDGSYRSGCQWVEDSTCSNSQTKTVSCTGTYQVSESYQVCEGEYRECEESGGLSYALNFFALITGQVAQKLDCTQEEMETQEPYRCTNQQCDSNYLGICHWMPATRTVTKQCSALSESECYNNAACSTEVTCIDCGDSDGGLNYNMKGTSTYGGGSLTDYCVDSTTLKEYSCVDAGRTYTCPNGCSNGACVEKLPNCADCNSADQCESGICSGVLGTTGKKCVDSGNCPTQSASQCEIPSGGSMCQGIYIANCNGGLWSSSVCSGTCDGTVCTEDPVLTWRDTTRSQILSSKIFSVSGNTISLVVENPENVVGKAEVRESDSGGDDIITSISMSEDAGKSVGMWTISAADLLLTADDSDGTYEFYFVYEGESSPIITVTTDPLVITCSNNIKDGDETDVDCGGSCQSTCPAPTCNDAKQNQDETDVDCGGSCGCPSPSCDGKLGCVPEKSLFWLDEGNNVAPSRIVLNSANLSGNIFKMLIQNPSANPGDFELKEYDGFLINDELGTFSGVSSDNAYEYSWTTKYSDFWNSESSDGDGVYEFYFEVDGERSLELEVEVVGTMPTCDDGIKNGAETGVDYLTGEGCGGECPACPIDPCLSKTVCSSYTTEGECGQDNCNAANKSAPVLGQNEKATCYWDESNSPKCNARITSVDPQGREIGFCNYIENIGADTCDDDGFLSYSYSAIWNWTENNVYTSDKSSDVNYILGSDGKHHYDPDRKSALCVPGSRTIQCPAQIQLSFFTWLNLVAAIILVIIVYIVLTNRKKKAKKKKVIKKKKIISKKKK